MDNAAAPKKVIPLTGEQRRLVDQHLDLVPRMAQIVCKKVDQSIPFDDLVAYGYAGLIDAAQGYDPNRGSTFEGYASHRIRGQIREEVRNSSFYTRTQVERFKDANRLEEARQAKSALSETLEHIAAYFESNPIVSRVSLAEAEDVVHHGCSPESALHNARMRDRVVQASNELETVEREIVRLYYFEQKNLEQTGALLGMKKSWVSRLLARALKTLAEALGRTPA